MRCAVEIWYCNDREIGGEPGDALYRLVHETARSGESDDAVLELLFAEFNRGSGRECSALDEKELRSMSVNDVVKLRDGQDVRIYRCGSFGWSPIEGFARA